MARAVAPWSWRRLLRDYGPNDPGFLLAMLILGTYMDESGFAYPSQATWARAARKSARMIQRYIARGRREGWIAAVNAGRGGKGWAFNAYRCCVPDSVVLTEKDEELSDTITSTMGEVDDDIEGTDTAVSVPSSNGHDTIVSAPHTPPAVGNDTRVPKVTTPAAHGHDTTSIQVPTQLCRTKSGSEKFGSRSLAQEEGALSRTTLAGQSSKESKEERYVGVQRRIHALLKEGFGEGDIVKMLGNLGVTVGDVQQVANP